MFLPRSNRDQRTDQAGEPTLSPPQQKRRESQQQQQQHQQQGFWFCFAALQLALYAGMAPLCWLVMTLTPAVQPGPAPVGAAPAVIVTSVGSAMCIGSVGLLCGAQCADASAGASAAVCLARLLWLRIFTAGAGVCAHLAAAGLLVHSAAQLLASPDAAAAAAVAALAGLAATNTAQAVAACVHIYNCVTTVQLSWRVAAAYADANVAEGDGERKGYQVQGQGEPKADNPRGSELRQRDSDDDEESDTDSELTVSTAPAAGRRSWARRQSEQQEQELKEIA